MDSEKAFSLYNYFQNWAVIGVTDDKEKFGFKIFKRLIERGKNVYGISPKYEEVEGKRLLKDISEVPDNVQVVVFVVNPKIGIGELEKIYKKGIKTIWLQPGTISDELIEKAKEYGMEIVDKCVIVVSDM